MVVLTGGGTGGHLSIVKNLKDELNKKRIRPVFIGSCNGQDRAWFENDDGFKAKYFFDTKGVVNKNKTGKLLSLSNIFLYSLKCFFIFKKYNIKKVISVGGYSAAAASFGAIFFKKELYIHEQNAKKGTLNLKLSKYAKEVFSSYDVTSPVKDYPVNENFFKLARQRENLKTLIFLGGSQGATFINNLAKELTPVLLKRGLHIIHQCGKNQYQELKKFYQINNLKVELYDFISDMPALLRKVDFAISRSGASTLWELCASQIPSIFIPFPYASADHQYYNAKFMEERNLSFVFRENEIHPQDILALLQTVNLKKISSSLSSAIHPNGAKKIIDSVLSS